MTYDRTRVLRFAMLFLACSLSLQAQPLLGQQGCQSSTVDLQGEDVAEKSRAFLAKLQTAVGNDDKSKVATMIFYPLLVIRGGEKIHVKSRSQFLARYDSIFDAHVRHTIAQQSAKCLFGNYQGTMIGDGEVWYREQADRKMKIVTVNPGAGVESTGH